MANRIDFQVGYTIDKSGLNEVQNALKQVQLEANKASRSGTLTNELKEASKAAQQLQTILNDAWNGKLNQLDLSKLNNSIKATYGSVEQLRASFTLAGNAGSTGATTAATAYNKFASSVLNTNLQLKQSNKLLDDMATTMGNTVRWAITSSIFNDLTGSIQKAYTYTKNLDSSLNDIRIVTDKNAESMETFARQANSAAKALGASTLDYTKASLIYYQQGLSDEEAQARAETTLKAANVTGQNGEEVSEQLTAVWNGYKVTAEETELYVDKLAAVAASTASDLEELSVGMSKVASAAAAMGVDIDKLSGMLSTVISVTRQAPESAGTAFKTIFARMEDLKLEGEDESGVSLGEVSSSLESMGVHILDAQGSMRELGEVIEEVGNKWNSGAWSEAEKQALAIDLAGKRQYNNLLALFENWDMYNEAVNTSVDSVGTLQHQQDIYMESTAAHLEQLRTEAEKTYDILFNQNTVNSFMDVTTGALENFNNYLTGLNGGMNSIVHMGSVIANVFSNQIGKALNQSLINIDAYRTNLDAIAMKQQVIDAHAIQGEIVSDGSAKLEAEVAIQKQILSVKKILTQEEYNELTAHQQRIGEIAQEIVNIQSYQQISEEILDNANATNAEYQERIGYEREFLNAAREQEQSLIRASRLYSSQSTSEENRLYLYNTLRNLDLSMLQTDEARAAVTNIMNDLDNNRAINASQLQLILEEQNNNVTEQTNLVHILEEAAMHRQQAENGTLERLRQEQQARQRLIDQTTEQARRQQLLSQAVSGLMTVVSLITTLNGIIRTLNNEDLTAGEKAEAIITTLLMTMPMLIMNFKNILKIGPGLATSLSTMALGLAGVTGAEIGATAATTSLTGAIGMLWKALIPYLPIIFAVTAAIGALVVAIKLSIDAYNANAIAAEEAANQVQTLTERYNELNSAVTELKDNISEYNDAIKALEDLTEGTDEYSEALENANDKARELIETYGLFDKWSTNNGLITIDENALNQAMEDAEKAESNAQIQTYGANIISNQAQLENISTILSREIGAVVDTGDRDSDGPILRNFTNDELQNAAQAIAKITEANNGVQLPDEQLKEQLLAMGDSLDKAITDSIDSIISYRQELEDLEDSTDEARKANEYYAKQIMGIKVEDTYGDKLEGMATDEEGNTNEALYNQLVAATAAALDNSPSNEQALEDAIAAIDVSKASSNEATNKILKDAGAGYRIKDDKSLAMLYAEKVLNKDTTNFTYGSGLNWNKGTVKDETGAKVVDNVSDDVMRHALARQAQIDQLTKEFAKTSEDNGTVFIDALDKLQHGADQFGKQFNANITGALLNTLANANGDISSIDFSSIFEDLSPEEKAQLSGLDKDSLLEALGLTGNDLEALGLGTSEEFLNAWNAGLDKYDSSAWEEKILNSIKSAKSDIETLMNDIQTGDITSSNISESEEYTDLLNQLDNIKNEDEDLTAAADLLGKTWLVGTQEYAEALEIVQDKLYAINLENLISQANEAKKKVDKFISEDNNNITIDIDSDPEAFETAMDDLLNKEYEINVAIHSEAEQEFNSISNAFDDIKEKASLIGEDFIVAAEDVRALNNTFPGILDGMTTLADGTVQLNEQVVQSAMGMAESEAQADAKNTIDKLNNQATLLRAKQQSYQNMANAALVLAKNETDADGDAAAARATISSELAELQRYNSKESSQSEMNNAVEIANNSHINAKTVAQNWQSAFQSMANSSYDGASIAIANMNAIANKGTATKGKVGINYSGSTGQSSEASIIQQTQEALDLADEESNKIWARLAELYAELADSSGAAANDIEGMVAQIGVTGTGLDKTLSNISSGKGASDDGGGSSNKKDTDKKDPEILDYLEDEADRYHDINLELEKLETNLNKLNKQQSKLYGKGLIKNLNKQLKVLEQQKIAYKEKIALAKQEAAELKSSLALQGVSFSRDGHISNYTNALQAKLNYVNTIVAQYNTMSAKEQENFKDTVEAAKEDYENFKKQIEDYDKLISNTIPDLKDKTQDAIDKEIENNITKFTMEVELRLEMAEAEKDFNEFKRKVIDGIKDDDILGNATSKLKDYTSYFNTNGTGTGSIQELTNQINETIGQIKQINKNGWSNIYGNDKAKAMEDLKKYYEELMKQLKDTVVLADEIKESYLSMIDEAVEAFDKQVDQYEYITDLLNHNMNIIGLVYGDKAYAKMAQYYEKIEQNNNQELDFLKKRVAYAEKMMQKETDPKAKEKWEKEWMDSLSKLNDKVEDSIQNLIDKYQNAIDRAFDKLDKKITNGKGLDYVNDEWDLINKNADQYLDTINSMYAIQDLENKYLEALDQTDSLSAQQKLNDMMNEQLGMLKDKDKLTQYDVDRANMLYEIALKQIALEEAQQNKSKMRLRRDSQGNYSYQFVSDEDSIAQAQQDLLAAQNDLYNLDKEKYKENLNEIYEYYVEFQEKYTEIMTDMSLTDEERQERTKLLQEQYGELINGLVEQNETIKQNLHESTFMTLEGLYAADADSFREMTGKDIEAFRDLTDVEKDLVINDLIPQWDSGIQHMADVFAGEGGFIPTCRDAFEELDQATRDYRYSLDELESSAGINFDAISEGYDKSIEKARDLLYANNDLIIKYMEEANAILDVIAQLEKLIAKYNEAKIAAIAATKAAYKFDQKQKKAAANAAGGNPGSPNNSGGSPSNSSNPGGNSSNSSSRSNSGGSPNNSGSPGGNSGSGGDGVPRIGDVVTYTGGLYYYDEGGTSPTGSRGPGKKVTITKLSPGAPYPIHVQSSDSAYGWLKQSQISGYDTGGYTGDWGDSNGKLAFLHKKELVLNNDDTTNFLTAIGIVRDMAGMLNNLNANVMDRLFNLSTGFGIPMSGISAASDTIEQNVHIEASFPNVQNSQEIKDAFNNLVNIASQRAFKTKK